MLTKNKKITVTNGSVNWLVSNIKQHQSKLNQIKPIRPTDLFNSIYGRILYAPAHTHIRIDV